MAILFRGCIVHYCVDGNRPYQSQVNPNGWSLVPHEGISGWTCKVPRRTRRSIKRGTYDTRAYTKEFPFFHGTWHRCSGVRLNSSSGGTIETRGNACFTMYNPCVGVTEPQMVKNQQECPPNCCHDSLNSHNSFNNCHNHQKVSCGDTAYNRAHTPTC
jgi:hypothetical protein